MMRQYKQSITSHPVFKDRVGVGNFLINGRDGIIVLDNHLVPINAINKLRSFPLIRLNSAHLSVADVIKNIHNYYKCLYGIFIPYVKVLIIRGIGFRATIIYNSENKYFMSDSMSTANDDDLFGSDGEFDEFFSLYGHSNSRYLLIRAGYSTPTYTPFFDGIGVKTLKRDRKVVCYSFNKQCVNSFVDHVYSFRPPNAFTGRGIRYKGVRYKLKPGKRGSVKGRIW